MRNTFSEALYEAATKKPECVHRRLRHFAGRQHGEILDGVPDRFINVGVAEQSMIGNLRRPRAQGLPAVRLYDRDVLALRPFEMVRDDLCYQNLP